ncbi:MAG: DUF2726 domain-containing protein [Burkholderiales bacterium]
MWYLAGLVWIVVMVFIVSRYTRRQRRRSTERATEMAALLVNLKANPTAAIEGLEPTVGPAGAPAFNRKARLLPQPVALLYYVFRTGLPDHEIFAGMALSDVVDVASAPPGAQREQLMRRLAQQRVDLVVCNKQLEIVAAVIVNNSASAAAADGRQFATQCLQAAGIRAVSVDPAAPPRHHQVHALIYG